MYATLEDLLERVDKNVLIALTDDQGVGQVDTGVVARAIADAQAVIDAQCQDMYKVPFAPVPDLVRMYAVDLAVYNLYSRRGHVEMPDVIGTRQKQVLAYLQQVRKGAASMGAAPDAATGTESHGALVSGNERIFTRQKMRNL